MFVNGEHKKERSFDFLVLFINTLSCFFITKTKKEREILYFGGLRLEPKPDFFQKLEENPKPSKALSKAVLGLSDLTLGLNIHIMIVLLNHAGFCSLTKFA